MTTYDGYAITRLRFKNLPRDFDLTARAEANGAAVWARWVAGVDPEISGPAVPKASGTLEIDLQAAIAADFQVTE